VRTLAVIPARANSRSLPGKNVRRFSGQPLILRAAECGKASAVIDHMVVSSDGESILSLARAAGVDTIRRPDGLAGDSALPKDAVLHAVDVLEQRGLPPFDIVVLLQPTSPLRLPEDIVLTRARIAEEGYDSAATFCEAASHPARTWRLENGQPSPLVQTRQSWAPRQELAPAYTLNGAVYAVKLDPFRANPGPEFLFGRAAGVIMPKERSFDIDTALDFALAEAAHAFLNQHGVRESERHD